MASVAWYRLYGTAGQADRRPTEEVSVVEDSTIAHRPAPVTPVTLLENALVELDATISFCPGQPAPSHTVVIVEGMDNPSVPTAMGRYLVGALAGAVDIDARLCAD